MNATDSQSLAQRAEAFATEVRANLNDIPTDELDDLLDGLGADLTERLADGDELGDAAQYAEELRQAAGIPPRSASTAPRPTFGERVAGGKRSLADWFDRTPGRRGFRDLSVSLLPVWWVLRGTIGAWVALSVFNHPMVNGLPISVPGTVVLIAIVILSVQWGRGKWLPATWLRHLHTASNILAIVLLLPFLGVTWNALTSANVDYVYEDSPDFGLISNGEQVSNIFAYDCAGNPLDTVRLYDQNGNPLNTIDPDGNTSTEFWDDEAQRSFGHTFNPLAVDAEAWNVFPLSIAPISETTGAEGKAEPATPKKSELPPLSRDCPVQAPDEATEAAAAETGPEEAAKP